MSRRFGFGGGRLMGWDGVESSAASPVAASFMRPGRPWPLAKAQAKEDFYLIRGGWGMKHQFMMKVKMKMKKIVKDEDAGEGAGLVRRSLWMDEKTDLNKKREGFGFN